MTTNTQRGTHAKQLLAAYADKTGRDDELAEEPAETLLTDLLADLMHYAHAMKMGFERCLRVAEMHFNDELAEDQCPAIQSKPAKIRAIYFLQQFR